MTFPHPRPRRAAGPGVVSLLALLLVACSPPDKEPLTPPLGDGDKADSRTRQVSVLGTLDFGSTGTWALPDEDRPTAVVVDAPRGAELDVEVRAPGLDPAVWIYGPWNGRNWGFARAHGDDIDWPDDRDAAIDGFEVDEAGLYLVVVEERHARPGQVEVSVGCSGTCAQRSSCGHGDSCAAGTICRPQPQIGDAIAYCTADGEPDVPLCPDRAREVDFLTLQGRVLDFEVEAGLGALSRRDPRGVCLYDLRNPEQPRELSCIHPPGEVSGVDLEDGILYAAVRDQGLWLYDVTVPHAPALLSSLVTDTKSWDVTVSGGLGYLGDGRFGLRIVDLSDPLHPALRGSLALERHTFPAFTADVAVRGTLAYVAAGTVGLATVDVADPDQPRLLSAVPVEIGGLPETVRAISLSGSRAYAAVRDSWSLTSFDLSDPSSPQLLDSSRLRWGLDVASIGDVAAVSCENDDLCLYQGDDLRSPVERVRAEGEIMALDYEAGHVFYASEEGWGSDRTGIGAVRIGCR